MGVYKYRTNNDETFQTNILGRSFANDWIRIHSNGTIVISKEYAWNGCTPKWQVLDLMIGTPDGAINQRTFRPKAYRASMLHDAIYQFKEVIPISRKEADNLFCDLLKHEDFLWTAVYYGVVRAGGGVMGHWNMK